jgi:hypothetical protein
MKRINFLVSIPFLLSVFFTSCSDGGGPLLPSVTGSAFEVIVSGDKAIWNDSAGRALFNVLDDDVPGLPQSEPLFNISFVPTKDFYGIWRPVRNIIIYEINDEIYTKGSIHFEQDKWAKPQSIVRITAPNQEELIKVVNEKKDLYISYLEEAERKRARSYYSRYANPEGAQKVRDMFGMQITLPASLNKYKTGNNFIWISNGNIDARQDIIIYKYPYKSTTDFTMKSLLHKRDSVLMENIPGPSPGSYMTTEYESDLRFKEMTYDEIYNAEIRGLWRVAGAMMGGPFVNRSFLDKEHRNIITIEAFVYAPARNKRNLMKQMEAVIYSLRYAGQNSD